MNDTNSLGPADSREGSPPPREPDAGENSRQWLVMVAVGVGSLLSSIDNSVVNIALPTIRSKFHADVATAEWVITIYLLIACSFLLVFGRLGDLRGQKPIYTWGFFLFVVSSAFSGLAPSILLLIVARALQGLGASMLLSSAPAILTTNFPASLRGRVLGLQVVMVYFGSMIGPMLGGWLTDAFSWRAVFFVNVPIGLTALYLSARYIPHLKPPRTEERFDFAGAVLFMAAFSFLIIALDQGHSHGWTSAYILRMFAAAIVLLAGFVWTESRTASPLLNPSMFRVPPFSLSVISSISNYIAMFAIGFLLPFYLIQGRGLNSSQAGLLITAQPVVMVVTAPLAGAISDRIGTRWPTALGMALMAAAALLLVRLGPATSMEYVGGSMALAGLAVGIFVAPNNSRIMGSAPRSRQGIASGVLATARQIGMILGVGISGAIFTTFLGTHAQGAFFTGIQVSFLVASGIAGLGCIASFVSK